MWVSFFMIETKRNTSNVTAISDLDVSRDMITSLDPGLTVSTTPTAGWLLIQGCAHVDMSAVRFTDALPYSQQTLLSASLSFAMNISLREVKMGPSQTMFITSSGTVLFTSYTMYGHGYRSTTVITSVGDQGSIVEVGLINWNRSAGSSPSLFVGAGLMELQTIERCDSFSTIFRGSDGRIYRWRMADDGIILAVDSASSAPIAIVYDGTQPSSTVDSTGVDVVLSIQPTGFHLLHEVVVTFILEQLRGRDRADHCLNSQIASSPHRGGRSLSGERLRFQLTKDRHWTRVKHTPPVRLHDCQDNFGRHVPRPRIQNGYITRFTADLTGELLRRYKYPSAYGGFGDIWKCDWLKDSRTIEVAVKVMRTNLMGGQKEAESKIINRELKVWVRLEHECVLPLYGISFDFGKFPAMVCPWLEGGTLSKYLEHHEGLQLYTRLQLLSDIADGLHYLHRCGIVHGDLTGSNVLIKDNGKACLSDFGLSRIFMEATDCSYLTSTVRGSIRWAAPELFDIGEEQQKETIHVLPSPRSDIYSFGSTMLQVLTGKVPYHYYKNDAQVLVALSRGLRPARPNEPPIDDVHWELMQRCWASQSKRASKNVRPSIEEIVDFLSVARIHCSQV